MAMEVEHALSRTTLPALREYEGRAMNDEEIVVGSLLIDLGSRRVFVGGEERRLTKKQFEALVVLASPPGRAISYDDLYKSVWQSLAPHDYRKTRCVSSLMVRLRREIAPRRIDSLWGWGFRLHIEDEPERRAELHSQR